MSVVAKLSKAETVAAFVQSAPPGELSNVVAGLKSLTSDEPNLVSNLEPAFRKYNEEQYATVKLPGSSEAVIVSAYNSLGDGRYFDTTSSTSFDVDHSTQKASNAQSHPLESRNADIIKSLQRSFANLTSEHFPSSTIGIYPTESDSTITLTLVANKYSPNNYWNGSWRSTYVLTPGTSLSGTIKVDVHYYEDGNVRLQTEKQLSFSNVPSDAASIVREIAKAENAYQAELNRSFNELSEGAFKGLRRQLPVTRQRVEWEKIGGYRLGQDIGGGRSK